uniref:Holin n=1 Tax=viral metagenome TaxID=1070528 RepID=A0A6H1ZZT9_9ZZZZ
MGLSILLTTLVPLILPAALDVGKSIISKFTGIAMDAPKNFKERIEESKADTERLQALAKLDAPVGTPSQWVIDLRASFRYITVGLMVLAAIGYFMLPIEMQSIPGQELFSKMASAGTFFIIGERLNLGLKRLK